MQLIHVKRSTATGRKMQEHRTLDLLISYDQTKSRFKEARKNAERRVHIKKVCQVFIYIAANLFSRKGVNWKCRTTLRGRVKNISRNIRMKKRLFHREGGRKFSVNVFSSKRSFMKWRTVAEGGFKFDLLGERKRVEAIDESFSEKSVESAPIYSSLIPVPLQGCHSLSFFFLRSFGSQQRIFFERFLPIAKWRNTKG